VYRIKIENGPLAQSTVSCTQVTLLHLSIALHDPSELRSCLRYRHCQLAHTASDVNV
jgi:hypothetical protein